MTKKKKIIFGVVIIVLGIGGYFGYKAIASKDSNKISYTSSAIEKGTIVVSVSGTGQVLSLDEMDIKSGASGDITYLGMENGKAVSKGALLAKIDTSDAERAVRDAQTNLETARLELDNLSEPVDELTLFQSENSLQQAKDSQQTAQDNLKKAYDDGFNNVSDIFLNLPGVMSGLSDILFSYNFNSGQWNIDYYNDVIRSYDFEADIYRTDTFNKYQIARKAYDQNFQDYKLTNRSSSEQAIEALIDETYQTTKNIAEAVKSANDLIQFYQDKVIGANKSPQALSATHLSGLSGYVSKTNSYLSTLLSSQQSIKNYENAIVNAENSIKEKTLSLEKVKAGPDELTMRAKKIAIQQKEEALLTAQQNLVDCSVYAPFSGVIAQVNVKKGDAVSSGTALASIITKQKVAEVSLNEVDASRVKKGQKATLIFDAIDGLSITGNVIEIDSLGTVSQGVVTYNVKISLDTQDERVKTGMSVSASIVVDIKQDVIIAPNSAIKTQNDTNYVEIMNASSTIPVQQEVVIGIADESFTEIISGLSVGEKVVTKTIDSSVKSNAQTATGNILNVGGGNRNAGQMGGGFRGN